MDLARGGFIDRHENVIAVGNSGTGKTHLALGIGLAACQRGYSVCWKTAATLVNELIEARDSKQLQRAQKALVKVQLLIVDDSALSRSQKPEPNYYLIFSRNATNEEPLSSPAIYPSTNGPPSSAANDSPAHCWIGSPITPTSSPATAIPTA